MRASMNTLGRLRNKFNRIHWARRVNSCKIFWYVSMTQVLLFCIHQMYTEPCVSPSVLIVVLTSVRARSLQRLLSSLAAADYGCAQVDLKIYVDAPKDERTATQVLQTLEVITRFVWDQGAFDVVRRLAHAGLSQSWFETVYYSSKEYVAIFEDDMEVSPHFYKLFEFIHMNGAVAGSTNTGFCLHPNDWEVAIPKICDDKTHSKYLYLSPEPCNWGPIWKQEEWRKYLDWVIANRVREPTFKPYVSEDIAYNYNRYLHEGKDVQSSWVWRFNHDFSKQQLRYTFKTCDVGYENEVFLAINHKEPGEHYQRKEDLDNDPSLLEFDLGKSMRNLASENGAFVPQAFNKYAKNATSLISVRGRTRYLPIWIHKYLHLRLHQY